MGISFERYIKAIEKVLNNMVEKERVNVDISELWIDTSIPEDLIVEIIKNYQLEYPEALESITYDGKTLWKRDHDLRDSNI